jgi:hypothetical protein
MYLILSPVSLVSYLSLRMRCLGNCLTPLCKTDIADKLTMSDNVSSVIVADSMADMSVCQSDWMRSACIRPTINLTPFMLTFSSGELARPFPGESSR